MSSPTSKIHNYSKNNPYSFKKLVITTENDITTIEKELSEVNHIFHSFHLDHNFPNNSSIRLNKLYKCPPAPRASNKINYSW
jgi:hypothetical protein